jgi:hypothetical protein
MKARGAVMQGFSSELIKVMRAALEEAMTKEYRRSRQAMQ